MRRPSLAATAVEAAARRRDGSGTPRIARARAPMASSTAMVRHGEIVQAAVSRGDLARVRHLLRDGASATERGRHDTTALHWAAAANEAAIVRELLDHGADPNARAADGCSALHYAAREDAAEAVRALLAGGADACAVNSEGRTALQEVYDEEDEDGAAAARLLRDSAARRRVSFRTSRARAATSPRDAPRDSRSVGTSTGSTVARADAKEGPCLARAFGPINAAASAAVGSRRRSNAPGSARVDSGTGARTAHALETLTARECVRAAAHEPPSAAGSRAVAARARLGKDGRLSEAL